MKIFIQQLETGLYFQSPGQWVEDKAKALCFYTSSEAMEVCVREDLRGTHILLSFADARLDMKINPFPDRGKHDARF